MAGSHIPVLVETGVSDSSRTRDDADSLSSRTVSSRVASLTVYGVVYHEFVFLVICLHWFSMILWLLSPTNLFSSQNMSFFKKLLYSLLVGWVYIFCYINLDEVIQSLLLCLLYSDILSLHHQTNDSRQKMMAFYATMFLENSLLTSISLSQDSPRLWSSRAALLVVWGGFTFGLSAMILYYKFFHTRFIQLPDESLANANDCQQSLPETLPAPLKANRTLDVAPGILSPPAANGMMGGMPGVFNCRLNPALRRKKKMPSSFVPRPPQTSADPHLNSVMAAMMVQSNVPSAPAT